jgi:hypothetical protein
MHALLQVERFCVGCMPCGERTSSGSLKNARKRLSEWLMAGWLTNSFSAARVTLRKLTSASSASSRFKSS